MGEQEDSDEYDDGFQQQSDIQKRATAVSIHEEPAATLTPKQIGSPAINLTFSEHTMDPNLNDNTMKLSCLMDTSTKSSKNFRKMSSLTENNTQESM